METSNPHHRLTIFQVAAMLDVTRPTLRLYEKLGLIRPQRAPNGTRLYGKEDLVRMKLILRLKRGGLKLQEIHDLVVLRKEGKDPAELVPRASEVFDYHLHEIARQMVCLESLKEELVGFRGKLQAILSVE